MRRATARPDLPLPSDGIGRRPVRRFQAPIAALAALLAGTACPVAPRPSSVPEPGRPPVTRAAPAPAESKFEDGLAAELRAAPEDRRFTVLVDLTEQVDWTELGRRLDAERRPRAERRDAVVALLEQVAAEQQQRLLPRIESWIDDGRLDYVRPVAIVNRLVIEGGSPGILALAQLPEVARVLREWHSRRPRGDTSLRAAGDAPPGEAFTSWAISALGAERLWAQGLDGSGVVVAAIDSGVLGEHEQLRGRRIAGARGWFDPVNGRREPYDSHGHGTSVLSQAVGGNPGGRVLGIAPGARWAAALANYQNFYSRTRMTLAADWVLRVARPDVVVNAWSHDEGPCTDFDRPLIDAWLAAGIFVVFPAGNDGPGAGTGEAPAQLAGAFPDGGPVFAVGALDRWGGVHHESSRGPSPCGAEPFPSVAAPGAEIPYASALGPAAYGTGNGTSLSSGLVGGAAALLLQADPELLPWELERILHETARDLPPAGPDPASGFGAIDLPRALERVRERLGACPSNPGGRAHGACEPETRRDEEGDVIHLRRGATPYPAATPVRPAGSGGVGPSAALPLLGDAWHRRRRGALRPAPRRSERDPRDYSDRLLGRR